MHNSTAATAYLATHAWLAVGVQQQLCRLCVALRADGWSLLCGACSRVVRRHSADAPGTEEALQPTTPQPCARCFLVSGCCALRRAAPFHECMCVHLRFFPCLCEWATRPGLRIVGRGSLPLCVRGVCCACAVHHLAVLCCAVLWFLSATCGPVETACAVLCLCRLLILPFRCQVFWVAVVRQLKHRIGRACVGVVAFHILQCTSTA